MIIDFHTHIFPDKVAAKAIPKLASVIQIPPSMNGTITGLKASMEQAGVDLSIVLPVITDPAQFESIVRFAVQINEAFQTESGPQLLSFGSVHPASDHYKDELFLLKREGFRGLKVHPNYHGTHFDDIRYMRLLYTASELDLIVVAHTGYDPYTPDEIFCSPDMIVRVLDEVSPRNLVLAHMGNNEGYQESMAKLCGRDVYMDTSYSLMHMPEDLFTQMVHTHGADKVCFASDAPWTSQKEIAEKLQSLTCLSKEEKSMILSGNARRLLKL